jgi:hypothetical protein
LAEVALGGFKVVAGFIFLRSPERDDLHIVVAFNVYENDDFGGEKSERDQPLLAVVSAPIFAGDGGRIQNSFGTDEVQAVDADITPALGFVPRGHELNCIYAIR